MSAISRAAAGLLAAALLAASVEGASAASGDPINFFKKYVTQPIDKALRANRPTKVAAKHKPAAAVIPAKAIAIDVPVPRLKPALSVSAGVDSDWRPPVQVASLGAEGWTQTTVEASAGVAASLPDTKPDLPALDAAVAPDTVPAGSLSEDAPETAKIPLPVPKPPLKQVASLPPRPEEGTVPPTALAALGVSSKPLPAISERGCSVAHPVAVASLDGGTVMLSAKATLNEPMAEMVAKWVHDDIEAAATRILKDDLTGLRVAASYDCRSRDHIVGAQLSEHAFGNALDVSAFRVGKRWIEVGNKDNSASDENFLAAVRFAACQRFMTVLGPGEPYHDTHFHVDLEHRGKKGNHKLCQ